MQWQTNPFPPYPISMRPRPFHPVYPRPPLPVPVIPYPCPWCPPKDRRPWRGTECILNKPLWMVIPPEGVHLSCPVHPGGHHVFGANVTC